MPFDNFQNHGDFLRPSVRARSIPLADLPVGSPARIVSVGSGGEAADEPVDLLDLRLLEMGFAEGGEVEIAHTGLFGGDPLAIRLRGTLVAMRRREAMRIAVELLKD